jgi:hypothetical protein
VTTDSTGEINISTKYGGKGIDLRSVVGHISRNIKIYGSPDDNWGGSVYVYHWVDDSKSPKVNARGVVIFDGVEMYNVGKKDTEKAGI